MNPNVHSTPAIYALSRLYWMMLGPMFLTVLGAIIAFNGGGWLTAVDVAFFVGLAMLVIARWLEFQGGNPQTDAGEPATDADLRQYALGAILVGLIAWGVVNVIGNHWLGN